MSDINWLKEAIEKIDSKVDNLNEKVGEQTTILAKQSVILEDHTRRSLAAEENIEMLRKESRTDKLEIEARIKPIQTHVDRVQFLIKGTLKITAVAASVGGVIIGAIKLFL